MVAAYRVLVKAGLMTTLVVLVASQAGRTNDPTPADIAVAALCKDEAKRAAPPAPDCGADSTVGGGHPVAPGRKPIHEFDVRNCTTNWDHGYAVGKRFKEIILFRMDDMVNQFEWYRNRSGQDLVPKLAALHATRYPDYFQEMCGYAAGIGVPPGQMVVVNFNDEISLLLATLEAWYLDPAVAAAINKTRIAEQAEEQDPGSSTGSSTPAASDTNTSSDSEDKEDSTDTDTESSGEPEDSEEDSESTSADSTDEVDAENDEVTAIAVAKAANATTASNGTAAVPKVAQTGRRRLQGGPRRALLENRSYFDKVLGREFLSKATHQGIGCSDVLIANPRPELNKTGASVKPLLAHNEEEDASREGTNYVLIGKTNNVTWVAYAYAGELPSIAFGFNSYGLGFTENYVEPSYRPLVGVGLVYLGRALLEARDITDAVSRLSVPDLMMGVNFNLIEHIGEGGGRVGSAEVGPYGDFLYVQVPAGEWMFHGNMYHWIEISQYESPITRARVATATAYPQPLNATDALKILGDTTNRELPLFFELSEDAEDTTTATVLFRPETRSATIFTGNPRKGHVTFHFPIHVLNSSVPA